MEKVKRIPKTISFTPGALEKLERFAAEREIDLSNAISLLIVGATSMKSEVVHQQEVQPKEVAKRPVGRPPTKSLSVEEKFEVWLNQGDPDPEAEHYKGFASISNMQKERLMCLTDDQRKDWTTKMIYLYADKENEMSFAEFLKDKIA